MVHVSGHLQAVSDLSGWGVLGLEQRLSRLDAEHHLRMLDNEVNRIVEPNLESDTILSQNTERSVMKSCLASGFMSLSFLCNIQH